MKVIVLIKTRIVVFTECYFFSSFENFSSLKPDFSIEWRIPIPTEEASYSEFVIYTFHFIKKQSPDS